MRCATAIPISRVFSLSVEKAAAVGHGKVSKCWRYEPGHPVNDPASMAIRPWGIFSNLSVLRPRSNFTMPMPVPLSARQQRRIKIGRQQTLRWPLQAGV